MTDHPTRNRNLLTLPIALCDLVFGLVTLLSLFAYAARVSWTADMLAQFRVQYLLILMPVVIAYFLFKRYRLGAFLALGIVANLWSILPYYVPPQTTHQNSHAKQLRVIVFNVLSKNTNYDQVLDYVRAENPDVFVAIETSNRWVAELTPLTGKMPHHQATRDRNDSGMAIFSRLPFESLELKHYTKHNIPSFHAVLNLGKKKIQLIGAHPFTPMTPERAKMRNEQLQQMTGELNQEMSRIMLGDFNVTPWSPHFSDVLEQGGLVAAGRGAGPQPTWFPDSRPTRMLGPLKSTWLGGLKLDHVLVSPDLHVVDYRVGPALGSDHRPVIVDLK